MKSNTAEKQVHEDLREFNVRKEFPCEVPDTIPEQMTVPGFAAANPFVPELDPYLFRSDLLIDVLGWHMKRHKRGGSAARGLMLTGHMGTGKTSVIKQICARLNIPVMEATGHSTMEYSDLVMTKTVIAGNIVPMDGPLTIAAKHGYWFLFNEMEQVPQGELVGLNSIIEGGPLTIPENGGQQINPHPNFRFIVTGNTAGMGDQTGLYQGAQMFNQAFLDRFFIVEVAYPTPEQEKMVLETTVPNLAGVIRDKMIEFANEVRKGFVGNLDTGEPGSLPVTLSTRTLINWAEDSLFFALIAKARNQNPLKYSLDRNLGYRVDPVTRKALHEIFDRLFGKG